ncbi:MAG: hypothetical protein IPH59_10555 [bacterium]|nr:hypothetical protein [bacterium]
MFVDPARSNIVVDEDVRNQYRSTRSHNTVAVDGCETNSDGAGPTVPAKERRYAEDH